MTWEEKKLKLKQVAEIVGGKLRIEEFSDGNKRMVVEVRSNAEEERRERRS